MVQGIGHSGGDCSPSWYGEERIEKSVRTRKMEITPCMPLCSYEKHVHIEGGEMGHPQD